MSAMFLVYIPWVVQGPPSSNGTFKRHPAGDQPLLYNKLDGTNSKTTIPQWYHVLLMASIGNKQELEIGLLHKQTCHTLGRQRRPKQKTKPPRRALRKEPSLRALRETLPRLEVDPFRRICPGLCRQGSDAGFQRRTP